MHIFGLPVKIITTILKIYPLGDPSSYRLDDRTETPSLPGIVSVMCCCRLFFDVIHPLVRRSVWTVGQFGTAETAGRILEFHRLMSHQSNPPFTAPVSRGFLNITHISVCRSVRMTSAFISEALQCLQIEELSVVQTDLLLPVGGALFDVHHLQKVYVRVTVRRIRSVVTAVC